MQFLDEQNIAGQQLLRLVSRANAIIAELLRLSANVPPVFKLEDKATQKKYGEILMDFSYDAKADYFQSRIENNPVRTFCIKCTASRLSRDALEEKQALSCNDGRNKCR